MSKDSEDEEPSGNDVSHSRLRSDFSRWFSNSFGFIKKWTPSSIRSIGASIPIPGVPSLAAGWAELEQAQFREYVESELAALKAETEPQSPDRASYKGKNSLLPPVIEFGLEGHGWIPPLNLLSLVTCRVGEPLVEEELRASLQAIFDTGWFTDVRFATPACPGGIKLIFRVLLNPTIQELILEGCEELEASEIQQVLLSKAGQTLNTRLLKADIHVINQMYNGVGLFRPSHLESLDFDKEDKILKLFIAEGIKITKLDFLGNTVIDEDELRECCGLINEGDFFNTLLLNKELRKLKILYREKGWA